MDDIELSSMNSSSHHAATLCPSNATSSALPGSAAVIPSSADIYGMDLSFQPMSPCTSKLMETSSSSYLGDALLEMAPGAGFSVNEPVKKKRGRPRKYGHDGGTTLALSLPTSTTNGYSRNPLSDAPMPKRRGRPPGSGKKKQLEALGLLGTGFTPHVITIEAGEDIAAKIMVFSQQGPRVVCIISANGAIGKATLCQPTTSGGTITYQGCFEIVSLSGSFTPTGNNESKSGSLSVSFVENTGRLVGGVVAGTLTAATPVQVVLASFIAGRKPKRDGSKLPSASLVSSVGLTSTSSSSHGNSSGSSGHKPGSPLEQVCNDSAPQISSAPRVCMSFSWLHSDQQRDES